MTDEVVKVERKMEINRAAILWYIHLHVLGIYAVFMLFSAAKWMTILFLIFIILISTLGLTVGAHRLWAHQTFQASHSIKLFLILGHTVAGVGPLYNWVLAHRVHHKFYGTDRDPYNHNKGFWYSHVFSNVIAHHPDKKMIDREVDMRDVDDDMYVWVQRVFYWPMFLIFGILLPINTPMEYWGESLLTSVVVMGILRLAILANIAWLVNSALHVWGLRKGEKYPPSDSSVFLVTKSLWPFYHYMAPWDWKCSEFGGYESDWSTAFIKICHSLGLISHLKTTSCEAIREALYKVATKKLTLKQSLQELQEISELEATKIELQRRR